MWRPFRFALSGSLLFIPLALRQGMIWGYLLPFLDLIPAKPIKSDRNEKLHYLKVHFHHFPFPNSSDLPIDNFSKRTSTWNKFKIRPEGDISP
jgi:hypothetical protein